MTTEPPGGYSVGELVLVRHGSTKSQVAVIDDVGDEQWLARKWRDSAGKWGKARWLPNRVILGRPEEQDARAKRAASSLRKQQRRAKKG